MIKFLITLGIILIIIIILVIILAELESYPLSIEITTINGKLRRNTKLIKQTESELKDHKEKLFLYCKSEVFTQELNDLRALCDDETKELKSLYKKRHQYLELYEHLVEEMKKEKWWKRCLWIIDKRYLKEMKEDLNKRR